MGYRIGVDVGGTFTDFVLAREGGGIRLGKVPSSLGDQSLGVMQGIAALARDEGLETREERFTTIVLQPGHRAELDRHDNYAITLP